MALSLILRGCRHPCCNLSSLTKSPGLAVGFRNVEMVRRIHRKSIYKTEEAKKIRFYVLHRYLEYLKNYDKVLERSFPGAMKVYRVFTVGIKDFMKDLKEFVRIVRLLNTADKKRFLVLTRREIELYHQMPKDMRKVAPVLLISALPFANYVIFPLAYMLPRHLLTSHFWTIQQKSEFNIACLRDRLVHNKPVFRLVQEQLDNLKGHKLYEPWGNILGMLGSGVQPTAEQILECRELFTGEPYHLFYLRSKHVRHLVKMHELHSGWFRRTRLAERAVILKEMDKAILREGGVHNLPVEALRKCCFVRGLNPTHMRTEDLISWLNKWITISNAVDKETLSLLLHCPILLAYNEPSNWVLIYPKKE